MKFTTIAVALLAACGTIGQASAEPIPATFNSVGVDRKAIEALLDSYAKAVSTRNEALFESLLLNKTVPFSDVGSAVLANGAGGGTEHYEEFRKGVFGGSPFNQRFQDIHIEQDGPLAQVSLVFVNTEDQGSSWGWKTLQLLKVSGKWKIASEFYTGHPG